MRTYSWWLSKPVRVRKKYTLFLGRYYSPKEVKQMLKDFQRKKERKHERDI